ncbi:MAG: uroporphyrinogen decarboxylase family protein [Armatimonadota bacterium]
MPGSAQRVMQAFAHQVPDRTPLFEIFQRFQPIHWEVCGRNVATDETLYWDAKADGIAWEELIEAEAQSAFQIAKYFGLDMVRLNGGTPKDYVRPVKTGETNWTLDGVEYTLNERTKLVELAHPSEANSYSRRMSEEQVIAVIEAWEGPAPYTPSEPDPVYRRVRELAEADGLEWVYMGEIGAGTGVAFYPPFMLMWMLTEPELYARWLEMQKAAVFPRTRDLVAQGNQVIAMGGDVSSDKGPFISPALYHEFILPVIQEHVQIIHDAGGLAVYTSDGNHWDIKDDFFFNSNIDGYKEVDNAAGMTFDRLIEAGIDKKVCIIGNIDARYTLCHGAPAEVREEVFACLKYGQQSPGGHILHNSHSVHEDVKPENYFTVVNAYREFFGMEPLAR